MGQIQSQQPGHTLERSIGEIIQIVVFQIKISHEGHDGPTVIQRVELAMRHVQEGEVAGDLAQGTDGEFPAAEHQGLRRAGHVPRDPRHFRPGTVDRPQRPIRDDVREVLVYA